MRDCSLASKVTCAKIYVASELTVVRLSLATTEPLRCLLHAQAGNNASNKSARLLCALPTTVSMESIVSSGGEIARLLSHSRRATRLTGLDHRRDEQRRKSAPHRMVLCSSFAFGPDPVDARRNENQVNWGCSAAASKVYFRVAAIAKSTHSFSSEFGKINDRFILWSKMGSMCELLALEKG